MAEIKVNSSACFLRKSAIRLLDISALWRASLFLRTRLFRIQYKAKQRRRIRRVVFHDRAQNWGTLQKLIASGASYLVCSMPALSIYICDPLWEKVHFRAKIENWVISISRLIEARSIQWCNARACSSFRPRSINGYTKYPRKALLRVNHREYLITLTLNISVYFLYLRGTDESRIKLRII